MDTVTVFFYAWMMVTNAMIMFAVYNVGKKP